MHRDAGAKAATLALRSVPKLLCRAIRSISAVLLPVLLGDGDSRPHLGVLKTRRR